MYTENSLYVSTMTSKSSSKASDNIQAFTAILIPCFFRSFSLSLSVCLTLSVVLLFPRIFTQNKSFILHYTFQLEYHHLWWIWGPTIQFFPRYYSPCIHGASRFLQDTAVRVSQACIFLSSGAFAQSINETFMEKRHETHWWKMTPNSFSLGYSRKRCTL